MDKTISVKHTSLIHKHYKISFFQLNNFYLCLPLIQFVFERLAATFTHKVWRVREGMCGLLIETLNRFGARSLHLNKLVPYICKLLSDPNVQVSLLSIGQYTFYDYNIFPSYQLIGWVIFSFNLRYFTLTLYNSWADLAKKTVPHFWTLNLIQQSVSYRRDYTFWSMWFTWLNKCWDLKMAPMHIYPEFCH